MLKAFCFLFNQSIVVLYVQFLGIGIDMPQISRSALVPFSAEQMYKLVNDVIAYPSFCLDVLVVG